MKTVEKVFISFKFNEETIKYPIDKIAGTDDIFRTIIQGKEEGWTLSHMDKEYSMAEIKGMEITFEEVEVSE